MRIRACLDETPAGDGSCAVEAWVEQPSLLPPLPIQDALDICASLLLALASVMAIKIVAKKTQ